MARARFWGLGLLLGFFAPASPALAQDSGAGGLAERSEIRRTLRESLFLNATAGLRYRGLVYAEDAAEGPDGRGELRLLVNGRYGLETNSPFSLAADLGFVGTAFAPGDPVGDSLASPYDDLSFARNFRLLGAYAEYRVFNAKREERFSARLGRLHDLELRRGLLMYDGGSARFAISEAVRLSAYVGRRVLLDGEMPDQREAFGAAFVIGGAVSAHLGAFSASLQHRFEEVHRPSLRVSFAPTETMQFGLGGELTLGGAEGLEATGDDGLTGRVRLDGQLSTLSYQSSLSFMTEIQMGRDPMVYGRGGRSPSRAEVELAATTPISAARLDRLFFGPSEPHLFVDALAEHWLLERLALSAGFYAFVPLSTQDLRSFRPQVVEVYAGPELLLGSGLRAGLEGRLAFEDPGEALRIFAAAGSGERRRLSARTYLELPLRIGEELTFVARPEVELSSWSSSDSLASISDQPGAAFGVVATLASSIDWRVSMRYGGELLPEVVRDGVSYLHDLELQLGGTF